MPDGSFVYAEIDGQLGVREPQRLAHPQQAAADVACQALSVCLYWNLLFARFPSFIFLRTFCPICQARNDTSPKDLTFGRLVPSVWRFHERGIQLIIDGLGEAQRVASLLRLKEDTVRKWHEPRHSVQALASADRTVSPNLTAEYLDRTKPRGVQARSRECAA